MRRLTTVAAVNARINELSNEIRALRAGLPLDSQGVFIPARERAIADIEGNQAEIDRLYTLKRRMLNEQYWQLAERYETTASVHEIAEMLVLWKRNNARTADAKATLTSTIKRLQGRTTEPAPTLGPK